MTHRYDESGLTAMYPGSFNPFATGHDNIVRRTLKICSRVVIAIGRNPGKCNDDAETRAARIRSIYADEPRVQVSVYDCLSAEHAKAVGAQVMVRGVRNASDFEYERTLAETNLRLFGVETLLLPALPELAFVSSSMVRELRSFGHNVDEFLPQPQEKPESLQTD